MDDFPATKEPVSEKDASRTVVEMLVKADGSSVEPAGEKEDTAIQQKPPEPRIVKTPEDGIQHTTDPQKLEEDKEPQKYTF